MSKINTYRLLLGKPLGKIPLGRPRCRYLDNVMMDLDEVGWRVLTGLVWLRKGTNGELMLMQ
jgi:hypothetical protein